MPIKMVWFKIREDRIMRSEYFERICHETRHLNYDNSLLFSFFENLKNCSRKWNIEISGKIYTFFAKILSLEYAIHNPTGGRFSISPCDRNYLESFRQIPIGKIKLRNYLSSSIKWMMTWDSWGWHDRLIRIIR